MKRIYILIVFVVSLSLSVGLGWGESTLVFRIHGEQVEVPVRDFDSETYVTLGDLTLIARRIDSSATVSLESGSGTLRLEMQGKDFAISGENSIIVIDDTILNTKLPILTVQSELLIPESTVRLLAKFLVNVETITASSESSHFAQPHEFAPRDPVSDAADNVTQSRSLRFIKNVAILSIDNSDGSKTATAVASMCESILTDEGSLGVVLFDASNVAKGLNAIIEEINTAGVDLLLVLKTARSEFPDLSGYRMYCANETVDSDGLLFKQDLRADRAIPYEVNYLPFQEQSLLFASAVEQEMKTTVSGKSLGIKIAPIFCLKRAAMPSCMVELGYLSNENDEQNLKTHSYIAAQSRALSWSILRFKSILSRKITHPTIE